LNFATFIGGAGDDRGNAVAVDPNNPQLVTVVGFTWSIGFPTTAGVVKPRLTGATVDNQLQSGFVTKFQFPASGNPMAVFSTYLGGSVTDICNNVVIDSSGNEIVLGTTGSFDFPVTPNAYDVMYDSLFVAVLNPTGTQISYGTYFGTTNGEGSMNSLPLAYAGGSDIVVAGTTSSPDFPVTAGALNTTFPFHYGQISSTGFAARLQLIADSTVQPVQAPTLLQPSP